MSDTYQQPEAHVSSSVPSGLGVMQFSLTGLFVLMTVSALLVAVYFGVGRLVGMSTAEILTIGFALLSLTLPVVLVWAVGFTLALRRLDRNPSTASLTMIALGGMFLTLLVVNVSQMAVLHFAAQQPDQRRHDVSEYDGDRHRLHGPQHPVVDPDTGGDLCQATAAFRCVAAHVPSEATGRSLTHAGSTRSVGPSRRGCLS